MSDTASVQRTSTPLAMTWLARRRRSDLLPPTVPHTQTAHNGERPIMTHMGHTTKTSTSAARMGRAAINSTVAQQPPISTTDLLGPLVRPLRYGRKTTLYIHKLWRKKRAPCLVPKLSTTGRVRHLQAGEISEQNRKTNNPN